MTDLATGVSSGEVRPVPSAGETTLRVTDLHKSYSTPTEPLEVLGGAAMWSSPKHCGYLLCRIERAPADTTIVREVP